jgi:DNA-binding CsgD family transcriptional regulator/tetratricopeptide (TPR) repeat protein
MSARATRAVPEARSRFLTLTAADREALLAASVLGPDFSIARLARILARSRRAVEGAVQRAYEAGLLLDADGDAGRFADGAHAAIRGLVLTVKARAIQSRIARDLERRGADPAEIAERRLAAGEREKACAGYERAGELRFERGDFQEAKRLFECALAIGDERDTVRLRERISETAIALGRPTDALVVARAQVAALEKESDAGGFAEARLTLSRLLWTICEMDEAIAVGEQIVRTRRLPPLVLAEARAWLGYILATATRVEEAEPVVSAMTRTHAKLGNKLLAAIYEVKFIIAAKRGDAKSALPAFRSSLAPAERTSRATLGRVLNSFVFEMGPLKSSLDASAIVERLVSNATTADDRPRRLTNASLSNAETALIHGELAQASEYLRSSAAVNDAGPRHLALQRGLSVTIKSLLGDRAALGATIDADLIEAVLRSREPRLIAPVVVPQCDLLLRAAGVVPAQELIERALHAAGCADAPFWLELAAARLASLAGINTARRHLKASIERRRDGTARAALLLFDAIVAARSGNQSPRQKAKAASAADEFRRAGWRLHEADALEYAGKTAAAAEIYREVGAYSELRRLRIPTKRPRPGKTLQLTRRQREICGLASEGVSNAAIAARLRLSERTVGHHLSAAYERLGIRSRWQLRAALEANRHA